MRFVYFKTADISGEQDGLTAINPEEVSMLQPSTMAGYTYITIGEKSICVIGEIVNVEEALTNQRSLVGLVANFSAQVSKLGDDYVDAAREELDSQNRKDWQTAPVYEPRRQLCKKIAQKLDNLIVNDLTVIEL